MKRFVFLFVVLAVSVLPSSAQQYLSFVQKRAHLVSSVRTLGPLDPSDWVAPQLAYAVNYNYVYSDVTYHSQGNYGYIYLGPDPSDPFTYFYDYSYRSAGLWAQSLAQVSNPNAMFWASFGILLPAIPDGQTPNYSFSLSSASFSVAGLRYESVFVVSGGSGGSLSGWTVTRGSTVNTSTPFNTGRRFDLMQNVEIPSFAVSDYWFGPWFTYPVDAKVPTPQSTARQSQSALLIAPFEKFTTNVAWLQEGVYRPGLTLQPGYSVPRLQTYMEQYFTGAWKTDPASGQPPRTGTANWNGVGRINTATAIPAGILYAAAPYNGIYYYATNFGKVILTTEPQENGHYGEFPAYTLAMLVDKNRDGVIDLKDKTASTNRHVFWVNNDADRSIYEDHNLWDELDLEQPFGFVNDADFSRSTYRMPSLRDLEDYDRLHIRGLKDLCRDLPVGQGYTVKLEWKQILSGSPGIFVFKAAESTGGTAYLTTQSMAEAQILPTLYPTNTISVGASPLAIGSVEGSTAATIHSDAYRGTNDFFLYCGTKRGSGELAVNVYKNGQLVGSSSVFLDLRDVKELYERWTVGDADGGTPTTNAVLVSEGLPSGVSATQFSDGPSSQRPYILLVHGWNMAPWEKDSFAETAFKRLYWQGYTNRLGTLRWPTTFDFEPPVDALFDPRNYNNGEFSAWRSGLGLRNHLVSLNSRYPGKVYMVAHSMGNVVAGEALALHAEKFGGGPIVNTYVASQAAVPMQCYSATNVSPVYQMPFIYEHPEQQTLTPYLAKWPGLGWILAYLNGPINWDSGTPNVYLGWLETNRASVINRVNFYNPHDYALNMPAWGFNQLLKPDKGSFGTTYSYMGNPYAKNPPKIGGVASARPYFLIPPPVRTGAPVLTGIRQVPGYFRADGWLTFRFLDFESNLQDMYETMAYGSEARSVPLGITWDQSIMNRQLDVRDLWFTDPEPDPVNGTHGRHKWHSAQFRSNAFRQWNYWAVLLGQRGFQMTATP